MSDRFEFMAGLIYQNESTFTCELRMLTVSLNELDDMSANVYKSDKFAWAVVFSLTDA
jgi:hypothetical protein